MTQTRPSTLSRLGSRRTVTAVLPGFLPAVVALLACGCEDRSSSTERAATPTPAAEQAAAPTEPQAPSAAVEPPAQAPATAPVPPHPGTGEGAPTAHTQMGGHGPFEHGGAHGMPHDFSDAEHWAEVFDDPERDTWQQPEEVLRLMDVAPGMSVADIGAGTGYFVAHLSPAVGPDGSVQALDIEPSLVEYMSQRARREGWTNVSPRVVAPDDPGLEPDSLDRILIVNTWHHIADRAEYTRKLADALRPGGTLYIVDYTMQSAHGPPPQNRLEPDEVIAELEAGGLAAQVVDEPLPEQYIVVGRKP